MACSLEKYHSDNVFFARSNSVYAYNTLADFYTDANGYLANPNRTTSPVTLRRFQVQYMNLPGLSKPLQPLEAWYYGGYVQDQWHVQIEHDDHGRRSRRHAAVREHGVRQPERRRADVPRREGQQRVHTTAANCPMRNRSGRRAWASTGTSTRIRRHRFAAARGIFTGKPAYVWISNQIGNTGLLTGNIQEDNITTRPFNPNPRFY